MITVFIIGGSIDFFLAEANIPTLKDIIKDCSESYSDWDSLQTFSGNGFTILPCARFMVHKRNGISITRRQ